MESAGNLSPEDYMPELSNLDLHNFDESTSVSKQQQQQQQQSQQQLQSPSLKMDHLGNVLSCPSQTMQSTSMCNSLMNGGSMLTSKHQLGGNSPSMRHSPVENGGGGGPMQSPSAFTSISSSNMSTPIIAQAMIDNPMSGNRMSF